MSSDKFHYTYLLSGNDGKMYIGARSCLTIPEKDIYWSSSKYVLQAIKDGVVFDKKILSVWPSRQEAVAHEILLHDIFNVAKNVNFYNRSKQTSTSFDTSGIFVPEETRKKRRDAMEKRYGSLKKDYRLKAIHKSKIEPKNTCKGWPKGKKQPASMVMARAKAQIGKTGMKNNRGAKPLFAIDLVTKKATVLVGRTHVENFGFDPSTVHKICHKKQSSFTHKKHTFRFLCQEEIKMFVLDTE
jgi:hypothetical protein